MNSSGMFRITLDSVSSEEVRMLDVRISKGPKWALTGYLDTTIFTKPTSLANTLSDSSAHPTHIHKNWPIARLHSIASICATEDDFRAAKRDFVSKLIKSSPRHPSVRTLERLTESKQTMHVLS